MTETTDLIPEHSEFETKYNATLDQLYAFKRTVEGQKPIEFLYVQGFDHFFIKEGSPFLRLRISDFKQPSGQPYIQLTSKEKPDGAKSNILRKEINLQLDINNTVDIFGMIDMIGYKFSFAIWKACHIYILEDATLVYYTVLGDNKPMTSFIEIELREDIRWTKEQGMATIAKYEQLLGLKAQQRVRRSLFEMYSP